MSLIHYLATPETLDQLADAHTAQGDELIARTFRDMAGAWRATQRQLAQAQAENTRLMSTLAKAHYNATRLEDLATATANVLAASHAGEVAA